MAIKKLSDGTYQVGDMTFSDAAKAVDYDNHVRQKLDTGQATIAAPAQRAAPPKGSQWSRMSTSSRVGLIAVGLVALGFAYVAVQVANVQKPIVAPVATVSPLVVQSAPAAPVTPAAPLPPLVITPTSKWKYEVSEDKMTGKKSSEARITSDNQLQFDFPYRGDNNGYLIVRRHPQYGLDVLMVIDKGQVLCHTYDCKVSVRFDDAAPMQFSGTEPADRSTTTIFLSSPERFITAAKKASRILVQFNAYHSGSPVLEFTSRVPLEWPPK